MRAKVYGGCAASIFCPPCIVVCYSVGAGVLETEIADYKKETQRLVNEFNTMSSSFRSMANMAGVSIKISKQYTNSIKDFGDQVAIQYNLLKGMQKMLDNVAPLRVAVSKKLDTLIEACDVIMANAKGKLADE